MTKKSKKKAVKTGFKNAVGPRLTTFSISSPVNPAGITETGKEIDLGKNSQEQEIPQDNEDSPKQNFISKAERRLLNEKKLLESKLAYERENSKRASYPIDLWFLISQYIRPEQVQLFSSICKATYYVCSTKKFWVDLYKRCVTEFNILPNHLKPKSITTTVGLKTRVVRSLFHAYEPFMKQVTHYVPISDSPETVENHICELFWWKQMTSTKRNITVWIFYFKLVPYEFYMKKQSIFKVKDLVKYNSEPSRCILRVTSPTFLNLRDTSGLCLTGVNVSVSRDMKHHKLKLLFHEYRRDGKYTSNQIASMVIVDPVLDIQVLPWWHPEYPHPFDHLFIDLFIVIMLLFIQ